MKKIEEKLLLISMLFIIASCGSQKVKFDPLFYVGDYENHQIINRYGDIVSCYDEEFNSYAALSKAKIKELNKILKSAKIPRRFKSLRSEKKRIGLILNQTIKKLKD